VEPFKGSHAIQTQTLSIKTLLAHVERIFDCVVVYLWRWGVGQQVSRGQPRQQRTQRPIHLPPTHIVIQIEASEGRDKGFNCIVTST
jgi:hypothetical protein